MKKNIALLILMVVFSSCESQVGTAVGAAFTNIFTGKGFSSSSGDEMYKAYVEKETLGGGGGYGEVASCSDAADALFMVPNNSSSAFSNIKDKLCSCKAWGSCDNKSCSCEKLCPDGFDILDRGQKDISSPENSLSFNNADKAFYAKDRNYTGYCWGHALVTQRFNRLATFNSGYQKLFSKAGESSQRIKYYKSIIEQLDNNMPVEIMGFRSLKEFSSDPEVKDLLQESVKKNWAENAMSIQGLSMVTGSDSQGEDYYTNLFNDVESRLKRNQQPAMVFNKEGEATAAHTVLMSGSGVDKKTGERYLCVRDNNFDANTIDKCQKKMFLTKAGKVRYEFLTPYVAPAMVGKMKMSYTENSNTVEQMKNLKTHCLNSKNCNSTASVTK